MASEHINAPTEKAWSAITRIFQYLKGTVNKNLVYRKGSGCVVKAWSNADCGSFPDSRRSVSGNVVKIGNNTVMWRSKKQATTALSTTESEYMAVVDALKMVLWLRQLMGEMGFTQEYATTIMDDNYGCIQLANNAVTLARSKHIDIRHHFVREKVADNTIELKYIESEVNTADILTKAICRVKFEKHAKSLGFECYES